jgi:cell division protein FtsW
VTTTADPGLGSDADSPKRPRRTGWFRSARQALDRPLTSYYLLLGATALLLTIGLIMVLSASSVYSYEVHDGDSYAIVKRQLLWVAIGIPCAWIASRLPYQAIRQISWLAIVVSVVLLALTAKFGVVVNGNKNWLALGPVQIQPSEIAKLAIVLWAAHVYAQKDRRLGSLHQVMVPVVPVLLGITLLVIVGRDLGTALVLVAILMAFLWVVGAPARIFTLALSVVGVAAVWLATTSSERRERLTNFVDPFKDYHDAGWQPAHGLFALSSGGVFGELLVIALFLTIAYAAIKVATQTADPFVRYMSFGIVAWLLGQMMVNVGMVLALLPVIGIPLPLISYGGSALLPTLVALGLLIGFARREPEAARALAQRRRQRSAGLTAGRLRRPT